MKKNMDINNFWHNRKAKIEVLKDKKRLFFTATVLEIDSASITFKDRDGMVFSFPRAMIQEMVEIKGALK